jgi:hypothetical protein
MANDDSRRVGTAIPIAVRSLHSHSRMLSAIPIAGAALERSSRILPLSTLRPRRYVVRTAQIGRQSGAIGERSTA